MGISRFYCEETQAAPTQTLLSHTSRLENPTLRSCFIFSSFYSPFYILLLCSAFAVTLQVQQFQETASRLHAQYAGSRADSIQAMEREVVEAWKGLLDACDGRRAQLVDTADKFRFFTMVKELMAWMESIIQQIETQEKPK